MSAAKPPRRRTAESALANWVGGIALFVIALFFGFLVLGPFALVVDVISTAITTPHVTGGR